MKRRRIGDIQVLAHEKLVEVKLSKDTIIKGVLFGEDQMGNYFVCFAKPELEAAGMTGHGPCLNKVVSTNKVTFLEGKSLEVEEGEEE